MFADDFQSYNYYSIHSIHDANVKIIKDIHVLADAAIPHSLILNPNKSKILIFGNQSGIDHSLRDLKLNIGADFVEI